MKKFSTLKSQFSILLLCLAVLALFTGCANMQDNRSVTNDAFPYYSQAPKVLQYTWAQYPAMAMHEPHPWRGNAEIWSGPGNWKVENVGTR